MKNSKEKKEINEQDLNKVAGGSLSEFLCPICKARPTWKQVLVNNNYCPYCGNKCL